MQDSQPDQDTEELKIAGMAILAYVALIIFVAVLVHHF